MSYNVFSIRAGFESLRSLANGAITGAYAAVGGPLENPVRLIHFVNNTDGDMIFSDDATDVDGKIFVPAQAQLIIDLTANQTSPQGFYLPKGTQWYVKQSTAPTAGSVYISVVYSMTTV